MANIGSTLTFSVTFTNAAGAAADPGLATFWLREEIDGTELQWSLVPPAGAAVTPSGMKPIVRDSAGVFHLSFAARKPERHTGFCVSTGTIFQSSEDVIFVRHSAIGAIDP